MARQLYNPEGIYSVISSAGAVGVGWLLYWYEAGTTTPINTYNAASGGSANANPLVADAEGRFSQIWLEPDDYKYVLKDAAGVTKRTQDTINVPATPPAFAAGLNDFFAGNAALPIANGGTNSATAPNAIAALGGLPVAGGTMTGNIIRSTKGVHPYWDAAGMANGGMFVTVSTDPDPTSLAGQVWMRYT